MMKSVNVFASDLPVNVAQASTSFRTNTNLIALFHDYAYWTGPPVFGSESLTNQYNGKSNFH
jgi:hypothetical protein